MRGDKDPKIFLARAEGKLDMLSALVSDREVVRTHPSSSAQGLRHREA